MDTAIDLAVNRGKPADAKQFFALGGALVNLLHNLSDDDGLTWQIADLRLGSAIATIAPSEPDSEEAERVIASLDKGIDLISSGNADELDWNPSALEDLRTFAGQANESTELFLRTSNTASSKRVLITPDLIAEIDSFDGVSVSFTGSIRGKLTGVNISKGHRASIAPFNGNPTVTVLFPENQADKYKDLLYEDVAIKGTIYQKRNYPPRKINAVSIDRLDESNVTWMQLWGIMPEITEGKSVKDYLEGIRGETG